MTKSIVEPSTALRSARSLSIHRGKRLGWPDYQLWLTADGTVLHNSGTPTVTPLFSFGGTTLWTDTLAAHR
jgi:hypothetical protein